MSKDKLKEILDTKSDSDLKVLYDYLTNDMKWLKFGQAEFLPTQKEWSDCQADLDRLSDLRERLLKELNSRVCDLLELVCAEKK